MKVVTLNDLMEEKDDYFEKFVKGNEDWTEENDNFMNRTFIEIVNERHTERFYATINDGEIGPEQQEFLKKCLKYLDNLKKD